jgi:hypothetical protein
MIDLSMDIWRNKVSGKYFIYLGDTGQDEGLFVTPVGEIKSLEKGLFEEDINEVEAKITEPQEQRFQEYSEKRRVYIASRIVDMIAEMEPYDLEEFVLRVKEKEDRRRRFDQEDDDDT